VARALMPTYSRLVLLDEPFTGLEQALRDELLLAHGNLFHADAVSESTKA